MGHALHNALRSAATAAALAAGPAYGQETVAPAAVTALAPGSVLEREMAQGGAHRYSIALRAGEYLEVVVEQRGADVMQVLNAPDGTVVLRSETPGGPIARHVLAVVAPAAGVYELTLKHLGFLVPPARYRLHVDAGREPGPVDLLRARTVQANAQGWAVFQKHPAEGLARFREALAGWEELDDRHMQMWTHQIIGYVHSRGFDQYAEARERYNRSLAMALELKDEYAEARLRFNLGVIERRLGRLDEARTLMEQALALHRAGGRDEFVASGLTSLGTLFGLAGEPQAAMDRFQEALEIYRARGIARGEAGARLEIGINYLRLGDPELALGQFELALPTFTDKEQHTRAECITQMGIARFQLGDLAAARTAYVQALGIYKTLGNRILEADTQASLGDLDLAEGDLRSARDAFESSLAVYKSRDYPLGEGLTQCRLAEVQRRLGDLPSAQAALKAALALAPRTSAFVAACAEAGLARSARDAGHLDLARVQAESALARAEALRADVVSPRMRASALAANASLYELRIDVLMRQHDGQPAAGHDVAALEVAERARARSLLEVLAESRRDIGRGTSPELRDEERSLRWRLNAAAARQAEALAAGRSGEAATLNRDLDSLSAQLSETEARIRRTSPDYAALTQAQPLTIADIRTQVLDPETQLLHYALGDSASYLWVVSQTRVESFRLAPRAEIEKSARRVYELTSAPAGQGGAAALAAAAGELSRMVLAPAAGALTARRLLLVVPGALQYVPFASLPMPGGQPMLARFELVSTPSASVVATLKADAKRAAPSARGLAVFADPVFEPSDPRLITAARAGVRPPLVRVVTGDPVRTDPMERALRGVRGPGSSGTLGRLPFSRLEANEILALAPRRAALMAIGFEATRETAMSPRLADYSIIHFATHGVLNARRPELSGVVLSLFDDQGRKQDGFLRLHDIYNLRLDAEVVVLSGCQTALGKDMRGEGLIGLTRGFMYAGARAVVASLWQVDDESTAELMKRFYRAMLKDGRRPADALRVAQLEMSRHKRWSAPFYWAGFVLQGEWR